MFPGVAKMPEPTILEMLRRYAEVQERFRPKVAVSGMVSCSMERELEDGGIGWPLWRLLVERSSDEEVVKEESRSRRGCDSSVVALDMADALLDC